MRRIQLVIFAATVASTACRGGRSKTDKGSPADHWFYSAAGLGFARACESAGAVGPSHPLRSTRNEMWNMSANLFIKLDFTTEMGFAFRCPDAIAKALRDGSFDPDMAEAKKIAQRLIAKAAGTEPRYEPAPGLKRRCDQGNAIACFYFAQVHAQQGLASDSERKQYYLKACESGLALGCFMRARTVNDEGPDRRRGMGVLERLCGGGDARACFDAFAIYEQGAGISTDLEKAAELRKSACRNGYKLACN